MGTSLTESANLFSPRYISFMSPAAAFLRGASGFTIMTKTPAWAGPPEAAADKRGENNQSGDKHGRLLKVERLRKDEKIAIVSVCEFSGYKRGLQAGINRVDLI